MTNTSVSSDKNVPLKMAQNQNTLHQTYEKDTKCYEFESVFTGVKVIFCKTLILVPACDYSVCEEF